MPRLAMAALIVIGVATAFYVTFRKLERSPPVQPEYRADAPPRRSADAPRQQQAVIQGIADIESKRPLIESALRSFFQAPTVDEKLAFSRDAGRVGKLMRDYYSRRTMQRRNVTGLGTCVSVAEPGHRFGYVEVKFDRGKPVHVIVEESADGRYRADWESLVLYGEMGWDDFLASKPTAPVLIRVLADRTPTKTGPVLTLRQPGQKGSITAQPDLQSPEMRSLAQQLELGDGKNVPLTLRLCYSEPKIKADHVRIVSCEGKGWMMIQ